MADSLNLELDSVRILIERVRTGDGSAQSELVQQVQSYVSLMADKNLDQKLRHVVGPSDIVQQTMIRLVNGIGQFQGDSTPEFFGWLNKIIENEALKSQRDQTRQKRDVRRCRSLESMTNDSRLQFEPIADCDTPQSSALASERVELLNSAMEGLSEDYATVIRLRNLEQLSFAEVAQRMGRTKDSVSNLWYRAVLKMKQQLEELDDNA